MDEEEIIEYGDGEEGEDEEDGMWIPPIKFRPIDLLVSLFILLDDFVEAMHGFTDRLISLTSRHANYKNGKLAFENTVRLELDSLPLTEKE